MRPSPSGLCFADPSHPTPPHSLPRPATLAFPHLHSETLLSFVTVPRLLPAQMAALCVLPVTPIVAQRSLLQRPALTTQPVPGQMPTRRAELGLSRTDSCQGGQLGGEKGFNRVGLYGAEPPNQGRVGTTAWPPAQEVQLGRPSKGVYENTENPQKTKQKHQRTKE